MNPFDSHLQNRLMFDTLLLIVKTFKSKFKLKIYQMDFWFEFFDNHMNKKEIICHDCHGFKWKNINIYPILIIFL